MPEKAAPHHRSSTNDVCLRPTFSDGGSTGTCSGTRSFTSFLVDRREWLFNSSPENPSSFVDVSIQDSFLGLCGAISLLHKPPFGKVSTVFSYID
jgi:hypothetical protein